MHDMMCTKCAIGGLMHCLNTMRSAEGMMPPQRMVNSEKPAHNIDMQHLPRGQEAMKT